MADMIRGTLTAPGAVGLEGISIGGMTGPTNSSAGWHLQYGVIRSDTEGTPSPPSLWISSPGAWRFRWNVVAGGQTMSIMVKQVENLTPYPTLTAKANPSIGVASDVVGTAPAGAGWKKIGPITVVATGPGVVWVELRNNLRAAYNPANGNVLPWAPCFFDLLST